MVSNTLEMRGISKHFGGVHALRGVHLKAEAGEVHALLGENGAGKSTLMKVLGGAFSPNQGEIILGGETLVLDSPHTALKHGISVIHQEFSLAKHLTVAENIFLGDLGEGKGLVNWSRLRERAKALLDTMGFGHLDVRLPVAELSVAEQQIVEICKALSHKSRVLVFDEPTAVLTAHETDRLFQLIKKLRAEGVCIVYISHRLEEVFELCDAATVLKDGSFVASMRITDIDQAGLVQLMVGRKLTELFPPRDVKIGETILRVEGLNSGSSVKDVSFEVRSGEVLGFSGLIGAGRTETMQAIFGARPRNSGRVWLEGKLLDNRSPRQGTLSGIGMLPEDRKQQGVLLNLSIRINAMMAPQNACAHGGWLLSRKRETARTEELIKALRVKLNDMEDPVSSLSGGNQQKVGLMKWVNSNCRVLILDEPTRGVDVGAKIEIYQIINQLAGQGIAVIVVSSDMLEVIGLCDRVIVMRMGTISGEVSGADINEQALIEHAMGVA